MSAIAKTFDQYRLQYASGGPNAAYIECWQNNSNVGTLVFVREGSALLPNKLTSSNTIVLYYLISQFNDVIQILRYEKPLYVWINTDNGMGNVGTSMELIGEQEG